MTRRFNLLILIPLISVLLIAAALLYLNYADLGGWRYPVERLISESLSREMAINGIFEPEIGFTTSITAGNLTLANADWGSSPTMLSIDHLELEFSLLSLLFRPIRIERLEIDGVRVLIETDVEGHANWHFQTGDEDEGDSGPLKLALGKIDLTDLEVISRDASLDHTVELGFTSLNIRGDQTDTLDLTLDGHLNRTGLSMTGRLGPLADLLQGKALQFDLTGNLGAIEFSTGGQIADLKTLGGADLRAEIHGADLAAAAEIFGLSDLEKGPFRLALDVRPETSGTGFELDISAGGVGAEIAGTVDSLIAPGMLDVMVEASGPNVATVGKVFGVDDLPVEDFSISGQVRWQGFSISCDNIKVRVGDNSLSADGVLGRPPLMLGTDFIINGGGPDISQLAAFVGVDLPKDPFSVGGRLIRHERSIAFEKIEIVVGRNTFEVDGAVGDPPEYAGTALNMHGQGPNLAHFQGLAGVDLPSEQFEFDGKFVQGEGSITLESVQARLGRADLQANGQLSTENGFVGTDLRVHFEDPDVGHIASVAGISGLPAKPLRIDGRVRVEAQGYRIDRLVGAFDDIVFEVDGRIGPIPSLEGSELQGTIRGPRLSALSAFVDLPGLPEAPFAVTSTVRETDDGFELEGLNANVSGNSLSVDGLVVPAEGLVGTDLVFKIDSPNLRDARRLAADWGDLPNLPAEPFSLSGRVVVDESGFQLENIEATLADATAQLAGRIGPPPTFIDTDLSIVADGPNASLLTALTGVTAPVAPFRLAGRIERLDSKVNFHSFKAQLGQHQVHVDGILGDPPKLVGTDLEINAEGPSLSLMGELAGLEQLPDQPYMLDGLFNGTMERFSAHTLNVRVGPSDLKGSFTVDITEKPDIQAVLISRHLDLKRLLERLKAEDTPTDSGVAPSAPETRPFLIPDEKIDLAFLQRADAEVTVLVKELILPATLFHDVEIDLRLESGRLEIERLTATDEAQGSVTGNLVLEPNRDQYRLQTQLRMHQIRPNLRGSRVELAQQPPIDIEIDLEARGATLHGLAGSANGRLKVVMGQGELDNSAFDLLATDILVELLAVLNPFAGKDKATKLQCAVLAVNMEGGVAHLEPLAIQTGKVTILGKGRIDLATESLDLDWVSKPRKGFGLSASMITNPYIKLGGTLTNPSIQLKELQAVASTGVAVATLGLSLVAKGMLDRATANRDVCQDALTTIDRQLGETPKQ